MLEGGGAAWRQFGRPHELPPGTVGLLFRSRGMVCFAMDVLHVQCGRFSLADWTHVLMSADR